MKNNVMLIYPPGRMFMRGEDRCQANIKASSAGAMRACNDLGYAAAILEKGGFNIFLRDYQTEKKSVAELIRDTLSFAPDIVMLSTTNATVYEDLAIISEMKKHTEAIFILKGAIFWNPAPGMLALLNLSDISYLLGTETDAAIGRICAYIRDGDGSPREIPGILYKQDGNFIPTDFTCHPENLDDIPFPARQYMNNALYVRPDTNEPMATIQTSRGCPSSCTFCLTPVISGKKVRFRSPGNVFEEISECYYKFGIKNFFFKADTFTINAQWVKELCEMIISSALHGKIAFTANSRVSPICAETLKYMKEAGCFTIAFGIESGSSDTLEKTKKGTTPSQCRTAVTLAREAGIPTYGFFMIGFPWETKEHLAATEKFIFELNCDFIELSVALPFYGTELYDTCMREGLINEQVLGKDYFTLGEYGTHTLSAKELYRFRNRVIRKYYTRPAYIIKKIGSALGSPETILNYIKYGLRIFSGK